MVSGIVNPLVGEVPSVDAKTSDSSAPDPFKQRQDAIKVFQRLVTHLESYAHYYTQQFLSYVTDKTKNQAIVDFANQLLDTLPTSMSDQARTAFDVERAFVDRQYIVVPAVITLTDADVNKLSNSLSPGGAHAPFKLADIPSAIIDSIEVPCDGIHLEVAAGSCVLQSLPPTPTSVELNVQGASLKASGA
jgi:hypothetical protein